MLSLSYQNILENSLHRYSGASFSILLLCFRAVLVQWKFTKKLQNRAAMAIKNSSLDASSRPLVQEHGWKTVAELIYCETKTMVYKSLHELAPEYLCNLFTRNSQCASHGLRFTEIDLRLSKKNKFDGQKLFFLEEKSCGITSQRSLSTHHH